MTYSTSLTYSSWSKEAFPGRETPIGTWLIQFRRTRGENGQILRQTCYQSTVLLAYIFHIFNLYILSLTHKAPCLHPSHPSINLLNQSLLVYRTLLLEPPRSHTSLAPNTAMLSSPVRSSSNPSIHIAGLRCNFSILRHKGKSIKEEKKRQINRISPIHSIMSVQGNPGPSLLSLLSFPNTQQ